MNKIAKTLLAAVVSACLAACALSLAGCTSGPSDEDQVRNVVSQDFDQIKNMDDATLEQLTSGIGEDETAVFSAIGLNVNEFLKAFFDGFDYQITDVQVDGDAASATVTCTMKSTQDIQNAWNDTFSNFTSSDITELGPQLMQDMANVEPTESAPITIKLHKDSNGEWVEDDDAAKALSDTMTAS